ncbi:Fructose dehydrogenase small subunit precursor [compost metagenome]
MHSTPLFPAFGLNRRRILGGALVAGAAGLVPWALAQTAASGTASQAPVDAFMGLSKYLSELGDLDAAMGKRLLAAHLQLDPGWGERMQALWAWVQAEKVGLAQLNAALKSQDAGWAKLPAQLMQGWYLGIVGDGKNTRVVAYEFALNARTVSDQLKPPTYAYGGYGSWTVNPASVRLKPVLPQASRA